MQNQTNNPGTRRPIDEGVHQPTCHSLPPICVIDVDVEDQAFLADQQGPARGIRPGNERSELNAGASYRGVRGPREVRDPADILPAGQRLFQMGGTRSEEGLFDRRGRPVHVSKHGDAVAGEKEKIRWRCEPDIEGLTHGQHPPHTTFDLLVLSWYAGWIADSVQTEPGKIALPRTYFQAVVA